MFHKTLSGTLLIAGTATGAGMLGIPLITARAGFLPALGITTAVWLFMLATGLLFLEATLWMHEGANVLSISRRFLGRGGQILAGGTYLFLYFCLMVAYYAAGAPLLAHFLGLSGIGSYLVYGLLFGAIVAFGLKIVDRLNYLFMAAMILSYLTLIGAGTSAISWQRFEAMHWNQIVFAAPILFTSFGFHNVIPSLVTYFDRNIHVLRRAIFWGTAIPFIIYLCWQALVIGVVPLPAIQEAFEQGKPATQALQTLTGHPWVMQIGRFFAFFAVITSFLGVSFALVDFLGDGLKMKRTGFSRVILCVLTFAPPFILTSFNPEVFVVAISVAGGFGEALLNGLLPVAVVWVGRYRKNLEGYEGFLGKKPMLSFLCALSFAVVVLEAIFIFAK